MRSGRAALELLRDLEDPKAEAYLLSSLAERYGKLGHYPSALSCLKRSLRLRKRIGDEEVQVEVLRDLTEVYGSVGDSTRARACSQEIVSKEWTPEGVLSSRRKAQEIPKYMVARTVGSTSEQEIEAVCLSATDVLVQMPDLRWVRSYYSAGEGKIHCEYEAPSVELMYEHARRAGIPIRPRWCGSWNLRCSADL